MKTTISAKSQSNTEKVNRRRNLFYASIGKNANLCFYHVERIEYCPLFFKTQIRQVVLERRPKKTTACSSENVF